MVGRNGRMVAKRPHQNISGERICSISVCALLLIPGVLLLVGVVFVLMMMGEDVVVEEVH